MSLTYFIVDFFVIVLAIYVVDEFRDWRKAKRDKQKKELICDMCGKPRKLRLTYDKAIWVCNKCNKLYLSEFK